MKRMRRLGMMSLMSLQLQSAYQGNLTWSMKSRSLSMLLGKLMFLEETFFHQAQSQLPQGCSFYWWHWRWFYFSRSEMTRTISSRPRWTPSFFNNHQSPFLKTIETEFEKLRFSEKRTIFWDQHTFCPELPVVLNQPSHHSQWLHCFYTFPL